MNSRTIRRATARKAQKQARNEAVTPLTEEFVEQEQPAATQLVSEQQLLANRSNAALSTGPKTTAGKAISSHNALKTGLTGRTVLLAGDDAALYEHHIQNFFSELQPFGDRETELAQSIADSHWRLGRIPSLEFGIYAIGRLQFAEEFQHLPHSEAAAFIQAKTFLAYQRQLNNLSIQECRLRRQCEKDAAELTRLQHLRAEAQRAASRTAGQAATQPAAPPQNGFEFSTAAPTSVNTPLTANLDILALPQAA